MVFVSRSRLVQAATGPTAGGTGTSSCPGTLIPISPSLEKATQAQLAPQRPATSNYAPPGTDTRAIRVTRESPGSGFQQPGWVGVLGPFPALFCSSAERPALLHLLSCNIWGFV